MDLDLSGFSPNEILCLSVFVTLRSKWAKQPILCDKHHYECPNKQIKANDEGVADVRLQMLRVGTERGLSRRMGTVSNVGSRENLSGLIHETPTSLGPNLNDQIYL